MQEGTPRLVTRNALFKRISRRLAHEDEVLRTTRVWNTDMGDHYITDVHSGGLLAGHVDLEGLGRELGVLMPDEKVEVLA